jgi:release factor glutamine methyltransferase
MPPDRPDESGTVRWRELLDEAGRRLREAGFADAELDARRIVEQASGHVGAALFAGLDELATVRGVHALDAMLQRRLAGEPLQYVLGEWSFRSIDVFVDRRVLIPRPETEVVVERALAELDRLVAARGPATAGRAPVVVDLGTGSGVIALSVAFERRAAEVWATDVSPGALDVARANLAGLGRAGTRVTMCEGSWFAALPPSLRGTVDLIISNPPYVAPTDPIDDEVRDWEPHLALVPGPTGFEAIDLIIDEAPGWLRDDGVLVVEMAPFQADAAADRARSAGFTEVRVGADLTGRARMVIAAR